MENTSISNYQDLLLSIAAFKAEKSKQEEVLKYTIREFSLTLNPVSMLKKSLHDLATDEVVKVDLAKVGLNMGVNFLIEKVLGRNSSIKGFLSSLLVEKLSGSFISNNIPKIISGISNLITRKQEVTQD